MLPTFETDRLILRPRVMKDIDDCIAMDRDPGVTKFIPGPWHDVVAHRTFVKGRIEADFGDGLGYWSIRAKENLEQFLGWILLIPADAIGPDIEIGWPAEQASLGQGLCDGGGKTRSRHAFETLELDRVIADIAPGNTASIRVAQNARPVTTAQGHLSR